MMRVTAQQMPRPKRFKRMVRMDNPAFPALLLFLSANIINVGNLGFNVVFSRLMGPEIFSDLTLLLTIKLSILSVLNAVQFEIAGRVASLNHVMDRLRAGQEIRRINQQVILSISVLLAVFVGLAWLFMPHLFAFNMAQTQVQAQHSYYVFALSLPFMAPLCLARGWAQGALDLKRIITSGQVEMMVRLLGSLIAWHMGAGLSGVALVIVLSIVAGWCMARPPFAKPPLPSSSSDRSAALKMPKDCKKSIMEGLFIAALPWACLQLGQILALDGDFLVSKLHLDAKQAGLSAVNVLVQRILFFGCFGLATALLPMAASVKNQQQARAAFMPPVFIVLASCLPVIGFMAIAPEFFLLQLFGKAFIAAAPSLVFAAISGSLFVAIYLVATFFLARSKRYFGYWVLCFGVGQTLVLTALPSFIVDFDMHSIIQAKALMQSIFACFIFWVAFREYKTFIKH